MRISDWSSDVCSSDLEVAAHGGRLPGDEFRGEVQRRAGAVAAGRGDGQAQAGDAQFGQAFGLQQAAVAEVGQAGLPAAVDRKSLVEGQSVSVRVGLGGRVIINKKNKPRAIPRW